MRLELLNLLIGLLIAIVGVLFMYIIMTGIVAYEDFKCKRNR